MSLHKSLVSKSVLKRHRNVLTRSERVKRLMDDESWQDGQSIFKLPKVKIRRVKAGGKVKKAETAAAAEGAAEGAAAAPAADAKKSK